MLKKEHIALYWEEIMRAHRHALDDICTARTFAEEQVCKGCDFCEYLLRHEQVLGKTTFELITLVDSLSEGMQPKYVVFPKKFDGSELFYRGLIASDGQYLPAPKETYRESYEEYAKEKGTEMAHKAIYVVGQHERTDVVFCDRHTPPSDAQKITLRDLLIDAEGKLRFFFVYDPMHPH